MNKIIIYIVTIVIILIFINNNEHFNSTISKMQKIPKIIIQTWKSDIIPSKYYNDIKSLMKNNKDYQYIFFTDNDIEKFLYKNYPDYYKTYNKLPYKIQKIDFFRYIAVYHYGGFYFDLDMFGFLPLDDLLHYDCIFPVDQNLDDRNCNYFRFNEYCNNKKININFLLGQYAFAACINNDFIKYIIDGIHNNIDKYIQEDKIKDNNFNYEIYIYKTTGPDYVTNKYIEYHDKQNIYILKDKKDQFFGNYARHNYYGTWK